jgi:hypothetical protein
MAEARRRWAHVETLLEFRWGMYEVRVWLNQPTQDGHTKANAEASLKPLRELLEAAKGYGDQPRWGVQRLHAALADTPCVQAVQVTQRGSHDLLGGIGVGTVIYPEWP